MFNINLNRVNPFVERSNVAPRTSFTKVPAKVTEATGLANYTVEHLKANFLPTVSFTGIHKDAVLGLETKIVGISRYQKNADSVKFRFLNKNKRGDTDKIQLKLKREPDNKNDDFAISVHHVYKGRTYKLGYLPSPMSHQIAPLMEDGCKFNASVVNVGGKARGHRSPYTGIRVRLEYLSNPDRSPNYRKIKLVKQAFQECMRNGSALRYQEERIIDSKKYKQSTKMKIDYERGEATVYGKGWEQLRSKLEEDPKVKNSRNHPQSPEFIDHVKNAVNNIVQRLKLKTS